MNDKNKRKEQAKAAISHQLQSWGIAAKWAGIIAAAISAGIIAALSTGCRGGSLTYEQENAQVQVVSPMGHPAK